MKIIVQQDGAPSHTGENNLQKINQYCIDNQIPIVFVTQPAQSPDLNINDLGLFHSLKTGASKKLRQIKTIQELKDLVIKTFENYDCSKVMNIWEHLKFVYEQIRKFNGQNTYPTHSKKRQISDENLNSRKRTKI